MLIAVADLSATYSAIGLVELSERNPLAPGEASFFCGDPLTGLLTLTERHRLKLHDVQGYSVCADSNPESESGLHLLQGLALTHAKPLVSFSRLKALALSAMNRAPVGSILVPVVDAEGNIEAGFFRQELTGQLAAIAPEERLTIAGLTSRAASMRTAVGFGPGYRQHEADLRPALSPLSELREADDAVSLEALARASIRELRAARNKRSARQLFGIDPKPQTTAAAAAAAFTEWR
jgi:hypothetical protein